jgi:DUF4097 and DUF4098 domain-containing protein YvlB
MNWKRIQILILLLALFPAMDGAGRWSSRAAGKPRRDEPQEFPLSPGQRINVRNGYELGSISIAGWNRQTVQAIAISEDRSGTMPSTITIDPSDARRVLVATSPAANNQGINRVHLEVKIPRDAQLEPVLVPKGELRVNDLARAIDVSSDSGKVIVEAVGSVRVQTKSGEIQITKVEGPVTLRTSSANVAVTGVQREMIADVGAANVTVADAGGPISLTATTGNIDVENAAQDVRVVSINGRTHIRCVQGRVDVSDTSGVITLVAIGGDVDVMTSGGRASFTGSLRDHGYYRLRTLSGAVHVAVPEDAIDFTVTLSSYSGEIETDVPPGNNAADHEKQRRVVLNYGVANAQVELDAFNGRVRFSRTNANSMEKCAR